MLVGRFLLIIPVLAIAGSLGSQAAGARVGRDVPDRHAAVHGAARRRDRARRRVDVLPGARARTDRRSMLSDVLSERPSTTLEPPEPPPRTRPVAEGAQRVRPRRRSSTRPIVRRAIGDSLPQARPAPHGAQPGDVRRRDRQRAHDGPVLHEPRRRQRTTRTCSPALVAAWLWFTVLFANFAEAVAEGRGQGAGRHAARARARTPSRTGAAADGTRRRRLELDAAGRRRRASSRPAR